MARTRNGLFGKAVDERMDVALCSAKAPTTSAFKLPSSRRRRSMGPVPPCWRCGQSSWSRRWASLTLSTGTALALLFAAPLAARSRGRAPYVPAPAPGVVLLSLSCRVFTSKRIASAQVASLICRPVDLPHVSRHHVCARPVPARAADVGGEVAHRKSCALVSAV
jgi:hypothetical protein